MENSFDENPKESAGNRENMAEAAVSFAVSKLGQLGDLLIQKVNLLRGVEEKVEWLKEELQRRQRLLNDAAERQASSEDVREWISDVRQVALDAADVIEYFILKVDNPRKSRGLLKRSACFPNQIYHLDRLGKWLESIEGRLKVIDAREPGLRFKSDESTSSSRRLNEVVRQRRLLPWRTVKEVVGLEEVVEVLIDKIVREEREGRFVASIVGMGGLGKTTLASMVYEHAAVKDRFKCRAWINVSNDWRPRDVIKQLVIKLLGCGSKEAQRRLGILEKAPDECLPDVVAACLEGRPYFIVLDDVWRPNDCKYLERLFAAESGTDKASRLLVTSRDGAILGGSGYVHKMEALDDNKSWQLFMKEALGGSNDGGCPPQLEGIAKQILEKCNGLPLAIVVMGGLLLGKGQSYSRWQEVLRGMNSYTRGEEDIVSAVMELSYHDLPPYLKSCFLCLSFFREDVPIRATKLVQIWIAQGFVEEEGKETMEEKARSYLDELINRNMVQVKELSKETGRVEICQVHDLLRDLSIKKAEEEIKFGMLRERNNSESSNKFRHCAVYGNDRRIPNKHLRSLFFYEYDPFLLDYLKSFELLRVLVMEGLGLEILPESIGSLIGLRYLGLSENKISRLPKSLGQLRELEVLDLSEKCLVPDIIRELHSLRHLYMRFYIYWEERLKLDNLKNLQTLSIINSEAIMIEHLSLLENLRELEINFGRDFNGWDWLDSLKHLVKLRIGGQLVAELPTAEMFPPNLSSLILHRTSLREDPMPLLGGLPGLEYLQLSGPAYDGIEMEILDDGFPMLRALCLESMGKLISIRVRNNGMPALKRLDIKCCCRGLEILPEGEVMRLMSNLQELEIWRPSRQFKSEKYSSIISKIPSVVKVMWDEVEEEEDEDEDVEEEEEDEDVEEEEDEDEDEDVEEEEEEEEEEDEVERRRTKRRRTDEDDP